MEVNNLSAGPQDGESGLIAWERASRQNAYMCFSAGCIRRLRVVGLVQRDSPSDKTWYMVPLCELCSRKKGHDLDIWDSAPLVPANAPRASGAMALNRTAVLGREG